MSGEDGSSGNTCVQEDETDPYIGFLNEEESGDLKGDIEDEGEEEGDIVLADPYVGMEFKSREDAFLYYNMYGFKRGFSVRQQCNSSSKNGVTSVLFVCSKEGFSKRKKHESKELGSSSNLKKTPEKDTGSSRTGCKAYFRMKLVNGAIWQVTKFYDDHNHPLVPNTPSKLRNLRSQKFMSSKVKQTIRDLNDQNVGPSKIMAYLSLQFGGKNNVPFKRKDVSNLIAMDNKKLLGRDVETTMKHFERKKEEDPEFFYAIEADSDGFVKHIFWADGRSRRAYLEFGDVVTFDTTYNTNKYSMPLAPFIGVNHHRQSIFFGMALLRSENTTNFCWLFETWLKAMYGQHPSAIITDQDRTMKKAIKIVFPNVVHRCCKWHIMRKAKEKLATHYRLKPNFQGELESIINNSKTVPDFENSWAAMIVQHKLKENNHLKNMYETRSD